MPIIWLLIAAIALPLYTVAIGLETLRRLAWAGWQRTYRWWTRDGSLRHCGASACWDKTDCECACAACLD